MASGADGAATSRATNADATGAATPQNVTRNDEAVGIAMLFYGWSTGVPAWMSTTVALPAITTTGRVPMMSSTPSPRSASASNTTAVAPVGPTALTVALKGSSGLTVTVATEVS